MNLRRHLKKQEFYLLLMHWSIQCFQKSDDIHQVLHAAAACKLSDVVVLSKAVCCGLSQGHS